MAIEITLTALEGYTPREREMNQKLNELFAEWHFCLKAGATAGNFNPEWPAWFVTDGFYPLYTEQKKKILFLGRESYGLAGHSYIDELYGYYKGNTVGGATVGQYPFHRRLFYVAWGLTHDCQPWSEIPVISDLAVSLAEPGGFSFAFMNFCKLSNETEASTRLNESAVAAFLECSKAAGGDFFNREIGILEPDLIITMKFREEWLNSLGEIRSLPSSNAELGQFQLKVGGRDILLLNSFHYSERFKKDKDDYYDPVVEAVKIYQVGV